MNQTCFFIKICCFKIGRQGKTHQCTGYWRSRMVWDSRDPKLPVVVDTSEEQRTAFATRILLGKLNWGLLWLSVSPVVVSALFVFPSHKNNVYMLSKVYCYFVWERKFLAVPRVGLMTHREYWVDCPFPVTWLDNVWEPTPPPPQYGPEPTI
jgi:hypothetical protein